MARQFSRKLVSSRRASRNSFCISRLSSRIRLASSTVAWMRDSSVRMEKKLKRTIRRVRPKIRPNPRTICTRMDDKRSDRKENLRFIELAFYHNEYVCKTLCWRVKLILS